MAVICWVRFCISEKYFWFDDGNTLILWTLVGMSKEKVKWHLRLEQALVCLPCV